MALIGNKATNDPIQASWANQIRDQTLQVTTSSLRPGSPTEGMAIYETDTDRAMVYDGAGWVELTKFGGWTAYTTVLKQSSGTITQGGTSWAEYRKNGRKVRVQGWVDCQSIGTSSGILSLLLPVTKETKVGIRPIGTGLWLVGGGTYYPLVAVSDPTDNAYVKFITPGGGANFTGAAGTGTTNSITTNDEVSFDIEYQSAS